MKESVGKRSRYFLIMASSKEAERNSSAQETLDSKLLNVAMGGLIHTLFSQFYSRYLNC